MRLADDPEDRCIAGLGFLEQAVGALRALDGVGGPGEPARTTTGLQPVRIAAAPATERSRPQAAALPP